MGLITIAIATVITITITTIIAIGQAGIIGRPHLSRFCRMQDSRQDYRKSRRV
ncbi:MAG: hypothetical protein IPL59_05135 [Candidatus Competibacteraceae bacterium]|uniref:hypothetical protein n=1 Tax=Candidatus Contendibacter odensensis TaxID=1400860 RepID=UPI0004B57685|nr:hypothetical protein [Candidatus Contendobacter odensis]MBK8534548.1 hypothetical protein [Candidatus Competibacteraceae bacterium]